MEDGILHHLVQKKINMILYRSVEVGKAPAGEVKKVAESKNAAAQRRGLLVKNVENLGGGEKGLPSFCTHVFSPVKNFFI